MHNHAMRLCQIIFLAVCIVMPEARAANLATPEEIVANSTAGGGNTYILNPGAYSIVPGSRIVFTGNNLVLNASNTSLTADQTGRSGIMLNLAGLTVGPGSITATGGGASGAHAVQTTGLTVDNGAIITTWGGTAGSVSGIYATTNGVTHNNGTVVANGGAGSNSAGIYVTGGAYTMRGGSLTATGGSGANGAGVRITAAGGFSLLGGNVFAFGRTGGGRQGSGISITGTNGLTVSGGNLTATGGDEAQNYGVYSQYAVTVDSGNVVAQGGTGTNTAGIRLLLEGFTQTGGTVTARAGGSLAATTTILASSGIYGSGLDYNLSNGNLYTYGGDSYSTHGIEFGSLSMQNAYASATGSSTTSSRGMSISGAISQIGGTFEAFGAGGAANTQSVAAYAGSYAVTNGVVNSYGGGGNRMRGLFVNSALTQNGGAINAYGGAGTQAYGMDVLNLNTSNGSIAAVGGSNTEAHGINVRQDLTGNGGSIVAIGGGGTNAHGISVRQEVNENGGSIVATGGGGTNAYGINAIGLTQNNGSLAAIGGSGVGAAGVFAQDVAQNNTSFTATGGDAVDAYGLDVLNLIQSGGRVVAAGGAGSATAYGINVRPGGTMQVNTELRISRRDAAAAVYLNNGSTLNLNTGSILAPVVDMAKIDTNPSAAAGLITGDGAKVTIAEGTTVAPYFVDTRHIAKNRLLIPVAFIDVSNGGTIEGEFANTDGGYFLEYHVEKISAAEYVIQVARAHEIVEEIPYLECDNSRELVAMMDGVLNLDPGDALVSPVWTNLDNSRNELDWRLRAAHVGKTMAPLAYTKLTQSLVRLNDMARYDFSRRLRAVSDSRASVFAADGATASVPAGRSPRPSPWYAWASPLYQQSSRFKPYCYEYDDAKEKLYGGSLGLGRDFGVLALGASYHYIRGEYDADYNDIDADNHGFTVGGRIHGLAPAGGWFNPWADFSLGHTWTDIDLKGTSYDYLPKNAKPNARVLSMEATLGNTFPVAGRFSLSPGFGVEYSHVRQDGYREDTASLYGLAVSSGKYDSLKPKAGLEVEFAATDRLRFTALGYFRYETMDRRSSFYTEAINIPSLKLVATGENLKRSSGRFGVGATYHIGDRASVSLSYDLLTADRYTAHQVNAGVVFAF